ncbi:two-component system CitB family response regulator [Planomicrobium soli]|uniref:Transcriptional regulatory protein n=1 Tax=Planomicrobium soli TaxID=1176648 RepID=A0A2P8GQI4_9BACL|nr:response regulator [Planomicrobium soli]PSL36222.1 two-component system CitB family response regulator [Planomicrobium soli]
MIEVLIIEDDKRIADIHKRFIEKIEGFQVVGSANTGAEAQDWIQTLKPQLILLDVYLPDVKGTELLSYIQQESPDSDIIFITAASETDIVKKAFKGGVIDYILKPLTFDRFRESLLSYRQKRNSLDTQGSLTEESIQLLWNKNRPTASTEPILTPKGIDPSTMARIKEKLADCGTGMTAEEMGAACGMSRSTARRYLEHLVTEQLASAELLYGTIGRPERRYFSRP